MKLKPTQLVIAVAGVLLAASSFLFFQASNSERQKRIQKEHELAQKQEIINQTDARIAEVNKTLAGYRDTSQKRINALEMAAREREESANALKDEVENLKKEKEAALKDSLEKASALSDLTDRLAALQQEKDGLVKTVNGLKKNLEDLKRGTTTSQDTGSDKNDSNRPQDRQGDKTNEPYGVVPDADLGLKIDPINLGTLLVSRDSGRAARVQEVNSVYDFIVVDVGEKEGLREGSVINIIRHNVLIGKAVVRHTRAGACAALILPEWKKSPIEKGDLVTKF